MDYVSETLDQTEAQLDLTYGAAHNFRIIAHGILSRKQRAYIGATDYGDGITDADADLMAKGLITTGKFESNTDAMALSHQGSILVSLTAKGRAAAEALVEFETDLRYSNMLAIDFDQWKRDVAAKLDD